MAEGSFVATLVGRDQPFFCLAVNRITSTITRTIQPNGYGKAPLKKAPNVASSRIVRITKIQSGLIVTSPIDLNRVYAMRIPIGLVTMTIR